MKNNLLNLSSVLDNGLGLSNAGHLCIIYTYLLQEYKLDFYDFISINRIGLSLDELVIIDRTTVYINIRLPEDETYTPKDLKESNSFCLAIIHQALLMLAERDSRMSIDKLEAIKNLIIEKGFSFNLIYRTFLNDKGKSVLASLIIHPEFNKFNFYVLIEIDRKENCKLAIYSGKATDYYIDDFFSYGEWQNDNEFIITGKRKEVEIRIFINECKVEFKNLTTYTKPPYFEMMRADESISVEEKERAYQDWQHSLPPAVAAVIRDAHN